MRIINQKWFMQKIAENTLLQFTRRIIQNNFQLVKKNKKSKTVFFEQKVNKYGVSKYTILIFIQGCGITAIKCEIKMRGSI